MKNKKTFILVLLAMSVACYLPVHAQRIDWPSFMKAQEMRWDSLGKDYYSGILLGNGLLGLNIYQSGDSTVRFNVGRTDVVDNRTHLYPNVSKLYTQARLPIGYFQLTTKGRIKSSTATLDIYDATAQGTLDTELGSVSFTAYVSAVIDVIVVDLKVTGKEPQPSWTFIPELSISPRVAFNVASAPANFGPNPPVEKKVEKKFTIYHQSLLNGGGYATVYATSVSPAGNQSLISIGYDGDNRADEVKMAENNIQLFKRQPAAENLHVHQKWWNDYYQRSFVALPDKRMESFYWAQLYKFACLSRPGKPMIDLVGPWTSPTPWTAIWWNLNVQLTYSPLMVINHTDLCVPLFDAINSNAANLVQNVPEQWRSDASFIGRSSSYNLISPVTNKEIKAGNFEASNLTWTLFYYYQYCLYTADSAALKDKVFPLLTRSTAFIIHLLQKDDKGIYHIPVSISPEYSYNAADANYVLSSLRWALTKLLEINMRFKLNDPNERKWKDIAANLTTYPQDETGFMIGKDVPLSSSHRHYSHLLMIYPYHLVNGEKEDDRKTIQTSLNHWISLKGALQGYTFTGAASIFASLGRGEDAYRMLNQLFDKYIQPNTLYKESGPVIETPLSAVTSISEMLLQSWGGKIRVFPAVPTSWQNIAFDRLLAEGGFEVSAKYENGKTSYVKIKSRTTGVCKVQTDLAPMTVLLNGKKVQCQISTTWSGQQLISIPLQPNEIVEIKSAPRPVNIAAVPYTENMNWYWGGVAREHKKLGKSLK